MCHCYLRQDGLGAVVVTDKEYPARVAFNLESRLLDEFDAKYMFRLYTLLTSYGPLEEREGGQPVPHDDAGEDAAGLPGSREVRQDYTDQLAVGRDEGRASDRGGWP